MTNQPPTVFAVETDSAWVVILAVSMVTFLGALVFRRLIGRPGGIASGVLLILPLLLPLVAALAFAQAALPELSVLRPASPSSLRDSQDFLHLLLLRDGNSNVVTPYALSGSAGRWIVLVGAVITAYMLVRRLVGMIVIYRLVRSSTPAESARERRAVALMKRVENTVGLSRSAHLLILPDGISGAFAVGGRRARVLISRDVLYKLNDDELEAALAHEIAHIEAHDVGLVFFAGLMRDLVAWNPLAQVAYGRLVRDREFEADRRAAAITGRPLDVASGLIKMCELMRGSRKHGFALAFARRRGSVSQRVTGLLALADARVVAQPRAGLPYALAAALVAVMGLQVGAAVADRNLGAFAFVWGEARTDSTELWTPMKIRQHHGVTNGRHEVKADRGQGARAKVVPGRAFRFPDFTTGVSMKERNLPEWIRWMSRRIRRVPPASLRWEGRQDWNMIPIVTTGMGVKVYHLNF